MLPGSREMEVRNNLPVMLDVCRALNQTHPGLFFNINKAKTIDLSLLKGIMAGIPLKNLLVVSDRTYDLLAVSHAGLAVSGTVTLETMLFQLPILVMYKVHPLTYFIFKSLARVPFISLPNLIAGQRVVREFIQDKSTPENVLREAEQIIFNQAYRKKMVQQLAGIKKKLGQKGVVRAIAREIIKRYG
ncbi:MAG: hypothetical protein PHF84_08900 [bacterium]|nr:hypothetical protein [bacterium]